MEKEFVKIENIPAILWGRKADSIYIYVYGKNANKEEANIFAEKAVKKGFQVLSFDLPEHGERTSENYPCVVWNGVRDLSIGETLNWDYYCYVRNNPIDKWNMPTTTAAQVKLDRWSGWRNFIVSDR